MDYESQRIYISIYLLVAILCIAASTASNLLPSKSPEEIIINPEEINVDFSVDQVVSKVRYIALETRAGFQIGKVDKIRVRENYILVLDLFSRLTTPGVYLYDLSGKAIAKIGTKGRGPESYQSLVDATIDPYNQTVDIYSSGLPHKIIKHAFDGSYISEILIPFPISGFEVIDKDTYVFYRYNESRGEKHADYHVLFVNQKSGKIRSRSLPYQFKITAKNEPMVLPNQVFSYKNGNNFGMQYWNSDNLYELSQRGVRKTYQFQFGKYTYQKNQLIKSYSETKELLNNGQVCCIDHVVETPKFLYFSYRFENKRGNSAIYSKQRKKLVQYKKFQNPFNQQQFVIPVGNHLDEIIFATNAIEFLNAHSSLANHSKILKATQQAISENDNPILSFYTLSDF